MYLPTYTASDECMFQYSHKKRKDMLAVIRKLTFLPAGSQWAIYKKLSKIRRRHGIVTCVLHTQFT